MKSEKWDATSYDSVKDERVTTKKSQISERTVQMPENLGLSERTSRKKSSGISGYRKVSGDLVMS